LQAQPEIEMAELDVLRHPAFDPDDALYPYQWDLPMIQAPLAWDVARGAGVTVAVLDTGVAYEDYQGFRRAPDLQQTQFVFPYDAISGVAHANDDEGHGTHVAGTIAEDSGNEIGAAGIAPQAAIMPVKVCAPSGCPASAIADGIYWAVGHGASVINLSLGGPSISEIERDALAYAEQQNVVVVAAAGNGGDDYQGDALLDYPAAIATVVSIGAVRYDGMRTRYSNYGYGDNGATLDLVAPGGDRSVDQNGDGFPDGILQNTFAFACSDAPRDYTRFAYCSYQGTSMATAHVSGVAALLVSAYPGLTAAQVRRALTCSARDLGPPGRDLEYGAGLVQASEALRDRDHDGIVDCLDDNISYIQRSGDVDCDASIDALDGFFILRDTAGITSAPCISAGDVNCDGSVDAADALLVLRFSAGLPARSDPACPPIGSPR
jgi:serine protease